LLIIHEVLDDESSQLLTFRGQVVWLGSASGKSAIISHPDMHDVDELFPILRLAFFGS
jgi:hypothetical protein